MDDVTQSILDNIKVHVWGGFDSYNDVQQLISDLLEKGADEKQLRGSVDIEFEKKRQAEKSWPHVTDVDRLDTVFNTLKTKGILCLHNAGYTLSDGYEDCQDALSCYGKDIFYGYCFYHEQDLATALLNSKLFLAYDHVDGDVPAKMNVAQMIQQELEKAGFVVEWDGTVERRLSIVNFDWKNRGNATKEKNKILEENYSLSVFFSIEQTKQQVSCESPIILEPTEVCQLVENVAQQPNNFIGFIDSEDTTIQFWVDDIDKIWFEIPSVKEQGSYGKHINNKEISQLINNLTAPYCQYIKTHHLELKKW